MNLPDAKAKGRGPLRKSRPLLSDFSKTWFGFQITAAVTPEIVWYLRAEPAFPNQFRCSVRCKSFLVPSVDAQFPECLREIRCRFPWGSRLRFPCGFRSILLRVSFPILIRSSFPGPLAGSASGSPGVPFPALLRVPLPVLRRLLSALSSWRIAPPLIRKLLVISAEGNGFSHVIFVEIGRFLWKCDLSGRVSWFADCERQDGFVAACDSYGSSGVWSCFPGAPRTRRLH